MATPVGLEGAHQWLAFNLVAEMLMKRLTIHIRNVWVQYSALIPDSSSCQYNPLETAGDGTSNWVPGTHRRPGFQVPGLNLAQPWSVNIWRGNQRIAEHLSVSFKNYTY